MYDIYTYLLNTIFVYYTQYIYSTRSRNFGLCCDSSCGTQGARCETEQYCSEAQGGSTCSSSTPLLFCLRRSDSLFVAEDGGCVLGTGRGLLRWQGQILHSGLGHAWDGTWEFSWGRLVKSTGNLCKL